MAIRGFIYLKMESCSTIYVGIPSDVAGFDIVGRQGFKCPFYGLAPSHQDNSTMCNFTGYEEQDPKPLRQEVPANCMLRRLVNIHNDKIENISNLLKELDEGDE